MNIRDVLYMRNTGKLRPRASIQDKFLARKLSGRGTETKTVDFTPIITVSDALAKNALAFSAKIVPVQSGSGDPSPQNIRPISGWTGANATVAGKNLYDKLTNALIDSTLINNQGELVPNGAYSCSSEYIRINPNTNYVFSGELVNSQTYQSVAFYDSNKIFISRYVPPYSNIPANFTTPANARFLRFNANRLAVVDTIQLEQGTTATTYEAYSANIYPVSWQTEAGTIFGGEVDFVRGKVKKTLEEIASYNGETLPGRWISDRDVYAPGTTPTIGAQVVYELATPLEYDIAPTDIPLLLGNNTIWTDTGDSSMTYLAKKA